MPRREPQSPAGPRTVANRRGAPPGPGGDRRSDPHAARPAAAGHARGRDTARDLGRDPELEVLHQALAEARAGTRRGVLLAGDAGIGKTSLAAQVAREAPCHGTAVLYGRCYEDLPVPYRPFAEALGQLVQHAPRELVVGQVRDHGAVLTHLVPELARRLDTGEDPPVATQGDLYMLFSAATSLLAEASARAPVMIVLDDLHWADAPTIPLLRYLLTAGVEMSALIVGTYRSEFGRDHPLRALVADLQDEAAVTRVELGGLSEQAVIEMTAARARERLDTDGVRLRGPSTRRPGATPSSRSRSCGTWSSRGRSSARTGTGPHRARSVTWSCPTPSSTRSTGGSHGSPTAPASGCGRS